MTTFIDQIKLAKLFEKFPSLFPVVQKLNTLNIVWMIGGSGSLYLQGNKREPGDIDILLPNDAHDLVDKEFDIKSFTYESKIENVRNSNPNNNHDIQFTSHLKLSPNGQLYDLSITQDVIDKRLTAITRDENIYVLPAEEVLLAKALLQRGEEMGKHDIQDINDFIKTGYKLDSNYLISRIYKLSAKERVGDIFSYLSTT